jgi:hypothetical protein
MKTREPEFFAASGVALCLLQPHDDVFVTSQVGASRALWFRASAALYGNNHNGTFTDITPGSGLDVEMDGIGVAVADFDYDGRDDVYITALEGDRPFITKARQIQRRDKGIWNQERQFRYQRGLAGL